MVGHDDPIHAVADRLQRIIHPVDAFQHQDPRPLVAEDADIVPVQRVLAHHLPRARIGADRPAIRFGVVLISRHADRGEVFQQHGGEPRRVLHDVPGEPGGRMERQQEPVAGVVFPVRRHDRVGGDDQGLKPIVLRTLDQLVGQFALLPHIKLEPQAEIRLLGDFLHRGHRAGGQREWDFRPSGGFRQFQFAFMPA